jgi:hypothetical protein
MECMRAMSSVCTGATSLAIGGSGISHGVRESARFRGGFGVVGSLRVERKVRGLALRRIAVARASASGADEPLDYKVDKAASEAGREVDETKQSVGSAAEDLKDKASSEAEEGKQSLGSTVEDFKRKAGETKSHAEDTASKVRGCYSPNLLPKPYIPHAMLCMW